MEQISAAWSLLLSSAVGQGRSGEGSRGCWAPKPHIWCLLAITSQTSTNLVPPWMSSVNRQTMGAHPHWEGAWLLHRVHPTEHTKTGNWAHARYVPCKNTFLNQTKNDGRKNVFPLNISVKDNFTIVTRPCPVFPHKFKYKAFFTLLSWTVLCQKTSWCSSMQQSQLTST